MYKQAEKCTLIITAGSYDQPGVMKTLFTTGSTGPFTLLAMELTVKQFRRQLFNK
jgi:hypothetical protein